MMKRWLMLLLLIGCYPVGVNVTRTVTGWYVEASQGAGVVIGSSHAITGFTSSAPCVYRKTAAGAQNALLCNVPNRIRLETVGEIDVQPLETAPIRTP